MTIVIAALPSLYCHKLLHPDCDPQLLPCTYSVSLLFESIAVAATVAAYGDYPSIAGHAFQQMVDRGMQWGLVCHFEGGYHSLLLTHDDTIRQGHVKPHLARHMLP